MSALKNVTCPNCGANLSIDDDRDIFFCEYCGTKIRKVPSSIMRKFVYKSGRTPSAQGRETCP